MCERTVAIRSNLQHTCRTWILFCALEFWAETLIRIPITQSESWAQSTQGKPRACLIALLIKTYKTCLTLSFMLLLEKEAQGMQGWPCDVSGQRVHIGTKSCSFTWTGWDLCVDRKEIKVAKAPPHGKLTVDMCRYCCMAHGVSQSCPPLVNFVRPFNRMALDVSSYGQDAQMFGMLPLSWWWCRLFLQNCFHVNLNATVIRCDDVPRRGRLCQRLSQRLFSTCSTSARSACSALSPWWNWLQKMYCLTEVQFIFIVAKTSWPWKMKTQKYTKILYVL